MPKPKRDPDLRHEYRLIVPGDRPTIRADGDADTGPTLGFRGHAAVFDSPTWIGPAAWGFQEQVARGAFNKTIQEHDIRFLVDHDPSLLLARNKAGTLRLAEDKVGLAVDADMAPTTLGRDTAVLLERGDLSQMSFGFQVVRDKWEEVDGQEGNKFERRTLLEVKLFDVSVVTYPAYEDTDAGLRAVGVALLGRVALPDDAREQLTQALREDTRLDQAVAEARSALGGTRAVIVQVPDRTPAAPPPRRDAQPTEDPQPTPEPAAAPPAAADPSAPAPAGSDVTAPTATEPSGVLLGLLVDHQAGGHRGAGLRACPACAYANDPAPEPAPEPAAA